VLKAPDLLVGLRDGVVGEADAKWVMIPSSRAQRHAATALQMSAGSARVPSRPIPLSIFKW
jgi:hypothetical protein